MHQAKQSGTSRSHRLGGPCIWLALGLFALTFGWPLLGRADGREPSERCISAAHQAARESGVPVAVLLTVALAESGRDQGRGLRPWPWAIHAQAKGYWAADRSTARTIAERAIAGGTRNVDLGCFQINYHWHGAQFASLDAMLDPLENARYAARLLHDHHARLGSWERAIGAYHSATPELAQAYLARIAKLDAMNLAALPERPRGVSAATPLPPTAGAITLADSRAARPFLSLNATHP